MSIVNDWQIDFTNKFINHIDGTLAYDTNSGTAPSLGNYIRGNTSGVVAKVIGGSDLGGTNASGTLILTNVTGRFQDNEAITILDSLGFDTVLNGGFSVGDTIDEQGGGTAAITVYAIEYNNLDDGTGTIYGIHNNAQNFTNNDILDNTTQGTTSVALATGAQTDGASFTGALVNGVIKAPSRDVVLNYNQDGVGTAISIPRFAIVQNADYAPTVSGFVQKVYGSTTQGSLRLSDAERTKWLLFDAQTANFAVNYTLTGATSSAKARIVLVVDNGTTGALALQQISGTFVDNEIITDNQSTPGSATANGTIGDTLVPYDNEVSGPFVVGEVLTNTTDSSTGIIRGLIDAGTTGLLVVDGVTSDGWTNNDAISGAGGATADINGSVQGTQWLLYDAESAPFTVGLRVTGGTSTATGTIVRVVDNGTEGALEIMAIVGTFQNNETITDSGSGSATANGTTGETYFAYDGEANGPFTVGNTLTNATTGGTGVIRGLQDNGTTGFLVVEGVTNKKWKDNDALEDGSVDALINGTVFQKYGDWSDNDRVYVYNTIYYDGLQTGQSFKLNDIVEGMGTDGLGAGSNDPKGKIISIDTVAGTIVLLNVVNGPFINNEQLHVNGTYIADVNSVSAENLRFVRWHADGNDVGPGLLKTEQLTTQGGLYSDQLNPVRDANQFYTFLQDQFDELGALDDQIAMSAQVKLQQYTLLNDWKIPDLSYRFLQSGSIQDANLNNIWTNYQTLGSIAGIEDISYGNTTPQPQIYLEQNGSVLDSWWLEGQIDILAKVKSNSLPSLTESGTGAEIDGGTVTIFVRRYGDTYDHFETTTIAGVAPIPLATQNDINNTTGTHSFNFDTGTATQALTVGEEIVVAANPLKRGVVTVYTSGNNGVSGTIEYILTGTTQFANNDVLTGQTSKFNKTVDGAVNPLVASYTQDIVIATVQQTIAHSGTTGTFFEGELVTQTTSGATAIVMYDSGSALTLGNVSGTFDNTNVITGAESGATCTASGSPSTNVTTINRDIGDGNGPQPYNAVIYMDRTNGSPRTLADMYEWIKYRTRSQETAGELAYSLLGGKGNGTDGPAATQGRIYTTLDDAYALVKASPFGTFAGGTFFGARGVFIQDMFSTDIRNFQLVDAAGTLRLPPNLQSLTVSGLASGDRVAVFRRPSNTPGSGIYTSEYSANGNQTSGAGTVTVTTTISSDTPSTGILRIYNHVTGLFDSYEYASYTGSTFTLVGTLSQTYNDGVSPIGDVYVPLIQEESSGTSVSAFIIYSSNIPLLARVRRKGILPFEVEGTFTSTGATITAIRSTDSIVD